MVKKEYLVVVLAFIYNFFGMNGTISYNQPLVEYYSFDDDQYIFFSQRVTWEEANILCISFDAKLAILNSKLKATNVVQAMAESDIAMEVAWIGGHRFDSTWYWTEGMNFSSFQYTISIDQDVDNFPPWSRTPLRTAKECLAINRKSHALPNFIDLDCRILKPFVCEKKSNDFMKNPVPSRWVKIKKHVYTLYHGRVTWYEAVTFCRSQGMRLAVINNQNIVNVLSHNMMKSRPDFENVWIGAKYFYGQWMWLSTGLVLNSTTDDSGYPPWYYGKAKIQSGCLLLDRHSENKPGFIEMFCDGKRDFICEKYPEEELENWMNEPIKVDYDNISITIYSEEKTWDESRIYCQENGNILSYINTPRLANLIVAAMGDHPKGINHLWLGGLYNLNVSEWRWIYTNEIIPANRNNFGFPPWAHSIVDADILPDNSTCLNLDRVDHTKAHFYGLSCDSKQAFACTINCDAPPPVANGNWSCIIYNYTLKSCSLQCDEGYLTLGIKNVNCSSQIGWFSKLNNLHFPVCLDLKNYMKRLTSSLSYDLQKTLGYYVMLFHSNEKFNHLALQLIRKLLTLFPLSTRRKMGMSNYFKDIRYSIPFKQTDTCTVLQSLLPNTKLQSEERINQSTTLNYTEWSSDIQANGRKILTIAIIDSIVANRNQEFFDKLQMSGHYLIIIGLNDDWETLMPLATVGFDRRLNIYLFTEEEFGTAVDDLKRIKDTFPKCLKKNKSLIRYTIAEEHTSLIEDYSKTSKNKTGLTSVRQPEETMKNNKYVSTTTNNPITQVMVNAKAYKSKNNNVPLIEQTTIISRNSSENIETYINRNENYSETTIEF